MVMIFRLKNGGGELIDAMQGFAELLDKVHDCDDYSKSLNKQKQAVSDPKNTPSAKMLDEMREKNEGFYQYAMRMSKQHHEAFIKEELNGSKIQFYESLTASSLTEQKQVEEQDSLPFATFLERYFSKSL